MDILVAVASKHGATREIAERIGSVLGTDGIQVQVQDVREATAPASYDAVVLGSAVYMGRWRPEARQFVVRGRERLREVPLWLFSSGPVGDPPMPKEPPSEPERWRTELGAVAHRVFPGRLERRRLGLLERFVVGLMRAPDGDFRDWESVDRWASGIQQRLLQEAGAQTRAAPK